jgi:hypothetical protein
MSKERLTKNQIELITKEVIKQLNAQQNKQKKEERDWRLGNVKLLLENYHGLKSHCEDIDLQLKTYEDTVFSLEALTLETLMKHRLKTARMMRYFDRMLQHFRIDCENGTEEDQRRFKVIYHRYLSEGKWNVQKLCKELNVEQGTVYRDTKLAINDISILMFGLSSLELQGLKHH